ncbi:hypothetical protein DYB32_006463 [Aphanomyces invadans]|uniref:Uncharacterized protein n=1 Tax=Aphanomyces invadans TaxID=157072 RepID=A0A3R6WJH9_9STRA|nr:hypothetical protein DYB32_006463 [Aphanomyces invadans]
MKRACTSMSPSPTYLTLLALPLSLLKKLPRYLRMKSLPRYCDAPSELADHLLDIERTITCQLRFASKRLLVAQLTRLHQLLLRTLIRQFRRLHLLRHTTLRNIKTMLHRLLRLTHLLAYNMTFNLVVQQHRLLFTLLVTTHQKKRQYNTLLLTTLTQSSTLLLMIL